MRCFSKPIHLPPVQQLWIDLDRDTLFINLDRDLSPHPTKVNDEFYLDRVIILLTRLDIMDLFAISELWSRDLCGTWRNNNDHSIISMNIYWSERMWLLGRSDIMRTFVVFDVICDFFFAWSDAKATMYIFVTKMYFKLNWKPDMCAHVCHDQQFF